jgi:hypothetical protein
VSYHRASLKTECFFGQRHGDNYWPAQFKELFRADMPDVFHASPAFAPDRSSCAERRICGVDQRARDEIKAQ